MERKINRSYSHKELALLYFPKSQPRAASMQLSKWINRDRELWDQLVAAGYFTRQRLYSPRQVMILFHYLGDPEEEKFTDK